MAWPLVVQTQTAIPVIGYLSSRSASAERPLREPFLKSLEEAGFVVGRNIAIEYRYSQGGDDQLSELASVLVRQQVAVLVATDNNSALAAKAATSTIPTCLAPATIRSDSASWPASIDLAAIPPACTCSRHDWEQSA